MPEIDVGAVLAAKAPRIARYVPHWAVEWLRRTVRERDINHILRTYWDLPPQAFIRACFREWGLPTPPRASTGSIRRAATSSPRTTRSEAWTG